MQDDIKLKISMLLDDELSAEDSLRLLERIEKDEELKAWWSRFNAASLALKSETYVGLDNEFVTSVSEKIRQEPTILAPHRRGLQVLYSGWAAVAASVFVVGVLVVGNLPEETRSPARLMAKTQDPAAPVAKHDAPALASFDAEMTNKEDFSTESRFENYLEAHNESSYATAKPNLLPYARVVTYSNGQ